jgi:uridylate kinase
MPDSAPAAKTSVAIADPELGSATPAVLPYKRVMIKLSGEALLGSQDHGIDIAMLEHLARQIRSINALGIEICLVVGGGNIFRGIAGAEMGIERSTADYMGMLATIINALALQAMLEKHSLHTRVMSAIPMMTVSEPYIRRRAVRHMEKGRIVIFAAGTGNPFFSTDTAAALRASEMACNAIIKATKVDGVYSADPVKNPKAVRYDKLSFRQVLANDLKVMDAPAIALARENNIPILVCSIFADGMLAEVLQGRGQYTIIHNA